MTFIAEFLSEAKKIIEQLDGDAVERMVELVKSTRSRGGRLFILGLGGSAGNASHAVNDFRKIVGIEAYAPTDNVSELTARINDEGWAGVFEGWLAVSHLGKDDLVFVFSVGGGSLREKYQPQFGEGSRVFAESGGAHYWCGGSRRWLYSSSG